MAGQRQNKNQFSVLYTGVNQDFIWLNAFHFEKKKKSYSKIVKCMGELRLLKGFLQGKSQSQSREHFLTLHLPLLHHTTATTLLEISFIENGVHFPLSPSESTET